MKVHYNGKHSPNPTMFTCTQCGFRAKQKVTLRMHLIKKHGDPMLQ
jgi:hypothetical protein